MTPHDRVFAGGTLIATAVVPALILLGAPFDEPRYVMGVLWGWALALLTIVPSYVLLSRAVRQADSNRFFTAWAGGTIGRMVLVLLAVVLFVTLVEQAPTKSFLLSFFLGYMLLTGLEVMMALGGNKASNGAAHGAPNGRHA
jgi:L-asparagine transporter-like permease